MQKSKKIPTEFRNFPLLRLHGKPHRSAISFTESLLRQINFSEQFAQTNLF